MYGEGIPQNVIFIHTSSDVSIRMKTGTPYSHTMGQFRIRSKYKKKSVNLRKGAELDSRRAGQTSHIRKFRPSTFVSQPRDQIRPATSIRPSTSVTGPPFVSDVVSNPKLPEVGMVLGKCKLTKQIGKGSSCLVFTALHQTLRITVALKIFIPEKSSNVVGRFREQFRKEAQLLARLSNPYVVRVLDFEDGELPYVILEYVDGQSMLELIRKRGTIDPLEACHLISCVAQGLEAAHKQEIIHRDIKPENILIANDGAAKLSDLGIARIQSGLQEGNDNTARGSLCGTPAYVAPEQAISPEKSDALSDVYSLGATFYHAVTGNFPYQAKTVREMVAQHITGVLTPAHHRCKNVPQNISTVIELMMKKNPNERCGLKELRSKLASILSSR